MHASCSANWLIVSYHYTNTYKPWSLFSLWRRVNARNVIFAIPSRWKSHPKFSYVKYTHTLIDPSVLSRPLIDQARSCWHNHTLSQFSQHTPSHARCKWSHLRLDIAHFALHSTRKTIKVVSICLLLCILEEALEKADAIFLQQAAQFQC